MILEAIEYGNKDGKYYIILECSNKSFSVSVNRDIVLEHQFSFSLDEVKKEIRHKRDIEIDEVIPVFGFANAEHPAYFYVSIKIKGLKTPFIISYLDIIDTRIVPSIEFSTKSYEEIKNVRVSK